MPNTETSPEEPAHDILAAEAFGFPAPDPDLHHHGPVVPPEDPAGIIEPHDVLAAEEFPMPASRGAISAAVRRGSEQPWHRQALVGAIAVAVLLAIVRGLRRA
jgi:hypothetical protein